MTQLVTEEPMARRPLASSPPMLVRAAHELHGRTVWHVNTTALGGGVAELLRSTVSAHTAVGLASRWLVTRGTPEFFGLTKQLHHLLHGMPGNGTTPTYDDARLYATVTAAHGEAILNWISPGDVIVLHDPQTLGLAPHLRKCGVYVIWRSHIGTHRRSPLVNKAWRFLLPYTKAVHQLVFSSSAYVPTMLAGRPVSIIPPAIDPASPKCRAMSPNEVSMVLAAIRLQGDARSAVDPDAARPAQLGSSRTVNGRVPTDWRSNGLGLAASVLQDAPLPAHAPVLVQISRWDPLKDMRGVLEAFAEHTAPRDGGPACTGRA